VAPETGRAAASALADLVQAQTGGIQHDTLFVDENLMEGNLVSAPGCIISARKADKQEREIYEGYRHA